MQITVESTDKIVELNGVPARVWEGVTESGGPVHCFITRISPQTNYADEIAQFEKELQEMQAPSAAIQAYPLRMIL